MSGIDLLKSNHKRDYWILFKRVLWMFSWFLFAKWTPRFLNPWRILILKLFGAKIGDKVLILSSVKIDMPWNLEVGDFSAIGNRVWCYNTAPIVIGSNTVVSQDTTICTASHDMEHPYMPLYAKSIKIGSMVWVAAESFVMPGIVIADGAVIGARSVVTRDIESMTINCGNPCKKIRSRIIKNLNSEFLLSSFYC